MNKALFWVLFDAGLFLLWVHRFAYVISDVYLQADPIINMLWMVILWQTRAFTSFKASLWVEALEKAMKEKAEETTTEV